MIRKVHLTYSSHIARSILMFLKRKPLYGDRNTLLSLLVALVITGCSSLNPDSAPDSMAQSELAAAPNASTVSVETSPNADFNAPPGSDADTPATPMRHAFLEPDFYDSPDYFDFEQDENAMLEREIEMQAKRAQQQG